MLQQIVAIHETWIWSFEPELKRQSSELHTKNSSRPVKFRPSRNCAKMLMIFEYDFHGVLMAHRVPTGETVNKEYYKMYIRTILRPAIHRKDQEMIDRMITRHPIKPTLSRSSWSHTRGKFLIIPLLPLFEPPNKLSEFG